MLFNSFGYLCLFLPLVVLGIALLRRYAEPRVAQAGLLIASVVFYGWSRPSDLLYLAASVLVNWGLARQMSGAAVPHKRHWLVFGLSLNLLYLCRFKYLSFFLGSLSASAQGGKLPPGISFFTLTQIMYLVDTYEGAVTAGSLFDHATFVSFFPYVLSGPLAKAKRMRRQLVERSEIDLQRVARGIYLFAMGLFKKAVIAESFAQVATYGFDTARRRSALEVAVYCVTYSMQIYFDFSGYSDMAIGSAEMLGIEIPRNFDAPFRSKSIIEFWERWHISLSSFITTYMYTPLVRMFKKATLPVAMFSVVVVMTIAGLWHGAAWTFVTFGLLHGLALAVNSFWRRWSAWKLPATGSWVLTFAFVNFAFLFFRSATLAGALSMVRELAGQTGFLHVQNLVTMRANFSLPIFGPPMLIGLIVAFWGKSSEQRAREFAAGSRTAVFSGALLTVAAVYMNSQIAAGFIYFNF